MIFSEGFHSFYTQFYPLHSCDEGLKSSAFLMEYLKNPTAHTAAFNMAFNTKSSLWGWYEEPGNDWRLRRFAAGMTSSGRRFQDTVFTDGEPSRLLTKN